MIKSVDGDLKPLFISFSGGETSGDMLLRLWNKWNGKRKIIVLFANTGQEWDLTLEFVHLIETYYGIPIVWLEAVINPKYGKGIKHKVVDYFTAKRSHDDDTPMELKIKKLGIPNSENPDCTRDLKTRVMEHYLKVNGYEDFYTCVGIRKDEGRDRLKNKKLFYEPYQSGITKPMVNNAWEQRPFRLAKSQRTECHGLGLKGYQGNCKWCYKKTDRKLYTIAKETPEVFDFPKRMETEYEYFVNEQRLEKIKKEGKVIHFPIRFYRENKSVDDILEKSKTFTQLAEDDTQQLDFQTSMFDGEDVDELDKINGDCFESCEPFK